MGKKCYPTEIEARLRLWLEQFCELIWFKSVARFLNTKSTQICEFHTKSGVNIFYSHFWKQIFQLLKILGRWNNYDVKKYIKFHTAVRSVIFNEDSDTFSVTTEQVSQLGVNFINILCVPFLYKTLVPKITKLCFGFEIFWSTNIGKKSSQKMLIKLTTELK